MNDYYRAPRHGVGSRLSAASSNTRVSQLIRPYPLSQKQISQTPPPPPCRWSIGEYLVAKKHKGQSEQEISVMVNRYYDFLKPSVHGFPTVYPGDSSCRYLF
jgi:hypothetical protein